MSNVNYNILYATTSAGSTTSTGPVLIPNLQLNLPGTPLPDQKVAVLTFLNIPFFWITGCSTKQDQGIIFSLSINGLEFARGGYSFPFTAQTDGRISMALNGVTFLAGKATHLEARWQVYGAGLTANIDTTAWLIAHLGLLGTSTTGL